MQEQIDSKSLAAQCCHNKNCYLVFEPSASELIYNDVIQMLEGQEFYPLFAGTRFAHVAEVSPKIIKLDSVSDRLLDTLLYDRKSLILQTSAKPEEFYAALGQQLEKTSDVYGLVMLRFWSPAVMKALLNDEQVYAHQWQCETIYLPSYSGDRWLSHSVEVQSDTTNQFSNVSERQDQMMDVSRMAYWLGSLGQWQEKSCEDIELSASSVNQLITSGITSQTDLLAWSDWLACHIDIQSHAEWLPLITAKTKHSERFAAAMQLEQQIRARS